MINDLSDLKNGGSHRQPTHVDCFSGAGGICTGFRSAGFKTLLAIEKVGSCVETYQHNHPDVPVLHRDIRECSNSEIKKITGSEVDVVTAGMPCETFSTAGNTSRSFYDARQTLYAEGIRVARACNAKMILLENVPAITSKRISANSHELLVDQIYAALADNGYPYFTTCILDAANFGVPQRRGRFFILATRDANLNLVPPLPGELPSSSVEDAFAGLPFVEANSESSPENYEGCDSEFSRLMKNRAFWGWSEGKNRVSYHLAPNHRAGTLKRFKLIRQGEGLKDLFDRFSEKERQRLQAARILPKKWYIQRNRRLIASEPSVTVTSHCLDELLHPIENRALTVREVARLQGFPDFYEFPGGPYIVPHIYETQDKYEQIGDCVPPLLARAWAMAIRMAFDGEAFHGFESYSHQLSLQLLRERKTNGANGVKLYAQKVVYRKRIKKL